MKNVGKYQSCMVSRCVSYLAVPLQVERQHPLPDTQIAERAVGVIAGFEAAGNLTRGQPFFLGVGFHRPVRYGTELLHALHYYSRSCLHVVL